MFWCLVVLETLWVGWVNGLTSVRFFGFVSFALWVLLCGIFYFWEDVVLGWVKGFFFLFGFVMVPSFNSKIILKK